MKELRNSMDDVFKQKLEGFSLEPPMHIWEQIQQKRNWRYKLWLHSKRRWPLLLLLALTLAGAGYYFSRTATGEIQLHSWPIPSQSVQQEQKKAAVVPASNDLTVSTPSENTIAPPVSSNTVFSPPQPLAKTIAELPVKSERVESGAIAEPLEAVTKSIDREIGTTLTPSSYPAITTVNTLPSNLLNYSPDLALTSAIIPQVATSTIQLEIEVVGNSFKTFKQLEAFSDSYLEYLSLRKESEKVQLGYGAGIRLLLTTPTGLRLRTGLDFAQINEEFDPNKISLRANLPDVEPVTQNKLRTYDLPMIIGYEKQWRKLSAGLNAGAFFNFRFKPQGDILNFETFEPISLSSEENTNQVFKNNIGVNWYGSIHFGYRVAPRLKIVAEPFLRYFPGYFNDPNYVVNQRYLLTGLSLGLRHRLK